MAVMGLTGCTSALSKNVLRGKLVRYEEQQSDYERMKVSVFRFDSGQEPTLYPVEENLSFKVSFDIDGEYLVYALVEGDDGFETESIRVLVDGGKIQGDRKVQLTYIYTNFD